MKMQILWVLVRLRVGLVQCALLYLQLDNVSRTTSVCKWFTTIHTWTLIMLCHQTTNSNLDIRKSSGALSQVGRQETDFGISFQN
jgi:hypothetical protein